MNKLSLCDGAAALCTESHVIMRRCNLKIVSRQQKSPKITDLLHSAQLQTAALYICTVTVGKLHCGLDELACGISLNTGISHSGESANIAVLSPSELVGILNEC